VIDYSVLPAVNATLNATSGVFLLTGYVLIRQRRIHAHRNAMLAAFTSSTLFLISYLIYHYHEGSHPFPGQGAIRAVYFAILISHVTLAAVILPLIISTLTKGLRAQYVRHKRVARWTFPLWMYVSVTGVVVYLMLYQIY
jgi:uncharacterized membrane protein YozB (DUF420 family)